MDSQAPQFEFKSYQYEPLPTPSSIRLLSMAAQQDNGPTACGTPLIECTLKTVDLATSPVYKALSYTWGSPHSTASVSTLDEYSNRHRWPLAVNGRVHFVTKNLFEALQQLFLDGVSIINQRFPGYGKTTLIRSCQSGDLDQALRCLQLGADVQLQDSFGQTGLHYAAENGHFELVRAMLRYGANDKIRNKKGLTPLECALSGKRGQHEEVVDALLKAESFEKRIKNRPFHSWQPEDGKPALWIDSICINQRDTEERTAQVALMSRIYSSAEAVVVWLGREDMSTQGAAQALEGHTITGHQLWDIKNLISRSWFTRKWVIQEFCLSRAVEMWCGAFRITCDRLLEYDLEHLLPALGVSASPATTLQQGRKGLGIWDVLTLRRWFEQIRSSSLDYSSHLSPPSLPALIALTWHFKSSDPRDVIFALLGIVSKYPVKDTPCNLIADYSKPTEEVFLEAGRLFVEAKGRNEIPHWNKTPEILEPLEGLSFTQHELPHTRDDIPSWVPSFHLGLTSARLWDRRFNASGRESHCTIRPSDPRLLKVDGQLFDRVIEAEHGEGVQKTPDMAAWFRMVLNLEARYQKTYDISRVEVLWRTLMADNIWHTQPPIAKQEFKEFVCEKMKSSGQHAHQLLTQLRTGDDSLSLPSPEAMTQFKVVKQDDSTHKYRVAERVFHASFKRFSSRRHLVRTELGYLGLGPCSTKVGDQIWLIAAARTPFILRPISDILGEVRFRFIGECYIHGIMHGEAVGKGGVSWEPIEIE